MQSIEIRNEKINKQSFSEKTVSKFYAVESEFIDCKFEGMRIVDACFGAGANQSKYTNCSFDQSKFSSQVPGIARFENCSFRNVSIREFFCVDIEMKDCVFTGEIRKGRFVGIHRRVDGTYSSNEFCGNDFSGLEFGDVGFSSIDLLSQTMPKSKDLLTVYDLEKFIRRARLKVSNFKGEDLYDEVLNVINIIELENDGGNNQAFIDRRGFPNSLQKGIKKLFALDLA